MLLSRRAFKARRSYRRRGTIGERFTVKRKDMKVGYFWSDEGVTSIRLSRKLSLISIKYQSRYIAAPYDGCMWEISELATTSDEVEWRTEDDDSHDYWPTPIHRQAMSRLRWYE